MTGHDYVDIYRSCQIDQGELGKVMVLISYDMGIKPPSKEEEKLIFKKYQLIKDIMIEEDN